MKGRISDLNVSIFNAKQKLTFEIDGDFRTQYDELKDKDLEIDIKIYREKRSKEANAYFWQLCGKLSAKINVPPVEIYRQYIKDIGDNYVVVPIINKAVDHFCFNWEHEKGKRKLGWLTETFPSKIEGYTNVVAYYGSSTYDKAQMGRLIEFLVEDCKENGIETRTPDEIADMLSLWETEQRKWKSEASQ